VHAAADVVHPQVLLKQVLIPFILKEATFRTRPASLTHHKQLCAAHATCRLGSIIVSILTGRSHGLPADHVAAPP
jgi:hypothetical protein